MEDKKLLSIFAQQKSKDALIALGYSASDLRAAGYSASDLIALGYSASDLRAAGYSASDLRALGYSASDLRALGYSASDLRAAGYDEKDIDEWNDIPVLVKPYTRLWAELQEKKRIHNQTNWGPEELPEEKNICNTAMCTAGHLVNMAGEFGYKLKTRYGWATAAHLIHQKSCPNLPEQNYGSIPQKWALAYIEEMANEESKS